MIIDSSALVAILFKEADAYIYLRALQAVDICRISSATYVETAMVIERETESGGGSKFDAFLRSASVIIEPFTVEQAHVARQAFLDFGKGRHPAGFNFWRLFCLPAGQSQRGTVAV